MNGRRIYHARGKVLGGSSSINGMIFQRGNPMDYERWGADPGMETWDYAHCLPYFKRMEDCRPPTPTTRSAGTAARSRSNAGRPTNPLFQAFFDATVQAGYPRTERRQRIPPGGLRRLRPQRAAGPALVGGARLPASGAEPPQPRAASRARYVDPGHLRRHARHRRRVRAPAARTEVANAGTVMLCGGAINTPQLLQLSGVGNAAELRRSASTSAPTCPASGENMQDHLEVYIQYACTQPVSMQKYLKHRYMLPSAPNGCSCARGPGATNHFEGGGFARSNDDGRLPEPDVPLPAHRRALRRFGAGVGRRLPGAHRPDVLRRPRHGEDHVDRPARASRRCGSTTCRPIRTGASGSRPSGWPATSSTSRRWRRSTAARRRPAPSVETDEQILDWVRSDGETALHPSCTAKMGTDAMSVVDPLTMGVHGARGAQGRRRLGHAVRHERQHLRAGDDGRPRRRPTSSSATPRCRRATSSSTGATPGASGSLR